jgi:uncharacterized protein
MKEAYFLRIADELNLSAPQVKSALQLLDDGATIPFISRYRKEATGSLDEVQITAIRDRASQLQDLDKRRETVLKSIQEQGKLTNELERKIQAASTMTRLEDLYLPYRPKRRTRATIAKEKGLEPLARILFAQEESVVPDEAAAGFLGVEKGLESVDDVLGYARDIIAEWVNEDLDARTRMRALFMRKGMFISKAIANKEEDGAKYRDYFEWEETVSEAPSHRILAMRRGEKEGFLSLRIAPPEDEALGLLESLFVKGDSTSSHQVKLAVHDSYKRLLSHSMETEIRLETKKTAERKAIQVFAGNLRQVLMAPPLGQKSVLAIDPGFRTGCKIACLDPQGRLMDHETIYPLKSEREKGDASQKLRTLCKRYQVEAIAIGNGTGGRETQDFVRELGLSERIHVVMVNESGASVYSASSVAREEFPDQDVTVRGAVSIGRRLMDPLAELVKIDPKSIGVGQYQHDVDQVALKRSLDDVVTSCVNAVGVEINTASQQLLTYVSGLGPQLAKAVIANRDKNGPFPSRESIKKVPRMGPKAYQQAAGFLRIRGGEHPLDESAVHPESYPIVERMASDLSCSVKDLMGNEPLRNKIERRRYVTEAIGIPTIDDIIKELAKPGRDPREAFQVFDFAAGIETLEDVKPGMRVPGVITNITAFGAFVDIGVHQDGLVHVSQLTSRFVKDPSEVVKVNQKVLVRVLEVDLKRKRISLSMKDSVNSDTKKKGKKVDQNRRRRKNLDGKRTPERRLFNNPFSSLSKLERG